MKAYIKGTLPPAPKPTLPRNDPEWLVRKMADRQKRIKDHSRSIEESRVRGRAAQKKNRYDQKRIMELLSQGYSMQKTTDLVGCSKRWVLKIKHKMEKQDAADQNNSSTS